MKVNGYILTYPMGYTSLDSSSGDSSAIEQLKQELLQDMANLDTKNLDTSEFESRITELTNNLQALLKMKADLYQTGGSDTPDDESDDTYKVVPQQLDGMKWGESDSQ